MRALVLCPIVLLTARVAFSQAPWHTDLAYPGGGYWTARVKVTVQNTGPNEVQGAPAKVTVGTGAGQADLVGLPAQSVRAVSAAGSELLFECADANGLPKHTGALAAGDVITLPAEVSADASADVYVYAGNAAAWVPPEYLGGDFANGGFELGETAPAGWSMWGNDDTHRMSWQQGGARTGDRCARCEVDAGTESTWVKYQQGPIAVMPGTKYRFTAWVKAQGVVGRAGWYVHVNGDKPQLINKVEGWEGSFDWREVTIEFEVPATGTEFLCGTVLYGTGTAWYDDAKLEAIGEPSLRASAGPVERMELKSIGAKADWQASKAWPWRAPVTIRNFTDQDSEAVLVSVNMHRPRTLLAKHVGWRYDLPVRVIDPESPGEPLKCTWADAALLTVRKVPARSEKVLMVYWSPEKSPPGASAVVPLGDGTLNLAQNGSMEEAEGGSAADWPSGEEGRPGSPRFTAKRVKGGVAGDWCLELNVPDNGQPVGWVGTRQKVPVKPGVRYLLGAYISGENVAGEARVHGHFLKADGSLSDHNPFFSTSPGISGTKDWTFTSTQVTTPPDCAFLEVHLTMNTTGIVRHDGVVLLQADSGEAGGLEAVQGGPAGKLTVWPTNPMVKVFHDDWPVAGERLVKLYACRNEHEPFQIALRAGQAGKVSVAATDLAGPDGTKLAAPAAYQVGYVPVDFPIGYASSREPAYHRLKPTSPGTDGWAGEWPDPLIPLQEPSFDVPANETQAAWFDVTIPPDAKPGEYRGSVEVSLGGDKVTVPVQLTVWPYVLPERKTCKALYDLRNGPGWDIFAGGERSERVATWYKLLASYDVSPSIIYPDPQYKYENGKLSIDYSGFDKACELFFDELHGNAAYTPWFFYALGWAYPPKQYFGFEPFTPEWNAVFQDGLRDFYDHCRQRGWDKYFVYYLSDEPHEGAPGVIENLDRIADLAREAVPDVLVYSSTWTHIKGLDDHLNLWGIGPQGTFRWNEVEERRAKGDRFWFTTDGQMCTDTPYLGIERLLPWFCFKYNVEAYEFWGVSWWTYDPWQYGWHTYIRQSNEGKEYYWVRYPNGDGFLTYPGQHLGRAEPVPSIRLMAAREGMEDYEIFVQLAKRAGNDPAAKKALERVRSLVNSPNKGGRMSTDIMPDPDAVIQARIAAGEALARLPAP
jgi:hypothetical protein